jgi:hypothetical protein
MMLNVVADDNYTIEKTNVNDVNNYHELIKKIINKKRTIQRQIKEIQERIQYRQDIRDGIVKDVNHFNYIENLKDYSNEDNITFCISAPYDLMLNFHKSIELKYGHNDPMSKNIITLISKFNESFLKEKQQHVTTSFLKYKNKEPRLDVLQKLKNVVDLLFNVSSDGVVSQKLIKQAIKEELNVDQRTAENYLNCIRDFAEQMMDEKLGHYSNWNLRGIREVIDEKLQNKSKQNKLEATYV